MATATDAGLETGWGSATPDEDNAFIAFVRNQGDLSTAIALGSGGRAEVADGVVMSDTGGPVGYLNQSVPQRPLRDVDDPVLDQIDGFWQGEVNRPHMLFSIWPTPDLAPRGWSLVGHPALVARPPGAHQPTAPPGVEVEVAEDATALAEAERVLIDGYPLPEASDLPVGSLLPSGLLHTNVRYRLGRLDGQPVAVAASHVARGVVNLCLAATLPAARRRGVWGALVWARADDAPELPAMAFTSDHSRPGFEHLGFLTLTRCTLWTRG